MSRLRLTKIAVPASPPANTVEVFLDTAQAAGYNTPVALAAKDESGNVAMLAHFGVLDYRFLKRTVFTTSGANTWTPQNGCRLAIATLVGCGGAGGGAATSSTQVSVGGDGAGSPLAGGAGGAGSASPAGGVAGTAASAGQYGAGGGGAGTNSTAAAGGAGIAGIITVDEYA